MNKVISETFLQKGPDFVASCHPDGVILPDRTIHQYGLVVQYEDTDAGGIVYHANYLNYGERARSAFFRAMGVNLSDLLRDTKQGIIIRGVNARYHSPALLHEAVIVVTRCETLRRASLRLAQDIIASETGLIFARLLVEGVWVNEKQAPCRFPDDIQDAIKHLNHTGRVITD